MVISKLFAGSNGQESSNDEWTESTGLLQQSQQSQHDTLVVDTTTSEHGQDNGSSGAVEDEDVPTMSVETFFDLVVAAAISSLSSILVDRYPVDGSSSSSSANNHNTQDGLWFVLRVFFVFNIWHSCMILNGVIDLYDGRKTAESGILCITFCAMFLVVAVVRTSQNDHNVLSGLVYVLGRLFVIVVGLLQSRLGTKRPSVGDATYERFTKYLHLISVLIPLECLPLLTAVVFFRNTDNGILIGGYTTAIAFFLWRRIYARQMDEIPTYTHSEHHIADLNRVKERYEVITLAVLGVLCILDQTEHSAYYVSFCAIVTAMAAFLLYFRARTRGRTEPWLVSAEASTQFPNLHILIFCVIPSMSVAFNEIVFDQQRQQQPSDVALTSSWSWERNPRVLLCYFGGLFLVLTGLMDLLAQDPQDAAKRPRLAQCYRVIIYFVGGAVLACGGQLPLVCQHSEIVVPIVFAIMATIQIWGTRRRTITTTTTTGASV